MENHMNTSSSQTVTAPTILLKNEKTVKQNANICSHQFLCYNLSCTIETAPQGWSGSIPGGKGGEAMTVFEALSLMLAFGSLLVLLLANKQKK
jgi:hypothetical protein